MCSNLSKYTIYNNTIGIDSFSCESMIGDYIDILSLYKQIKEDFPNIEECYEEYKTAIEKINLEQDIKIREENIQSLEDATPYVIKQHNLKILKLKEYLEKDKQKLERLNHE